MSQISIMNRKSKGIFDPNDWLSSGDELLATSQVNRRLFLENRTKTSENVSHRASKVATNRSLALTKGLATASVLLLAYSIEMYLKSGLTKAFRGCSEKSFSEIVSRRYGHKFRKTAREIEFPFLENDNLILKHLEQMVAGSRYPVTTYGSSSVEYATSWNNRIRKVWDTECFENGVDLANRIRAYVIKIDSDSGCPAIFESLAINNGGWLNARIGGHLSPRIRLFLSSKQMEQKWDAESVRNILKATRLSWICEHLDEAKISTIEMQQPVQK